MDIILIVWLSLLAVLLIAEAATVGLVSCWFAAGSLIAIIAYLFGAGLWLQIVLFFIVSIVLLIYTRPIAQKYLNSRVQPTNTDAIIGKDATVTERIDNLAGTGMATVGGVKWTARSVSGESIEAGTLTRVAAIEGVKVMLEPRA
jgi:membrane protein implicated in regulation of membrane protease activity